LKDFYVYEWFNVDTDKVFYVGKGRKNRYKDVNQRNIYFKNYYNKHKCDVHKVKTNIEENEAFNFEIELIEKYKEIGQAQCNLTNGGEGSTFSVGSWNYMFSKFIGLNIRDSFIIMENSEDYILDNLKTKSLDELEQLYMDYRDEEENIKWFNSLEIYDENGDLNIGWECFED
jgi:hypothetical protein